MNDCWNSIGVQGDRSCPELFRHVHCRNCPVYSAGAREVLCGHPLDQDATGTDAGNRRPSIVARGDLESLLVFRIGDEWLALPTTAIAEIVDRRPIHSIPHRQSGIVVGLANVRGELVACVALDRLLKVTRPPSDVSAAATHRLLVVRRDNVRAVCMADEIDGIHHVHADAILAAPSTADGNAPRARGVTSIGNRPVGVLDDSRLFQSIAQGMA